MIGSWGQENVFYNILERENGFLGYKVSFFRLNTPGKWLLRYSRTKNAFLGYKNNSFKKSKKDIFQKGLTHAFGPKMAIFPTFFLGNIGQENVFYNILERENGFLGYKNKKFKESKNWHFSKRG